MGAREERFTSVFGACYGPLWAYARRRVGADDVDDIVAETFTTAWRRLDALPAEPLPWLYGVAYRTISNHRRAHRRRLRLAGRLAAEPLSTEPDSDPGVLEALASLKPAEQEVLRLAAWEQLEPREIALALGCSANAASIRLTRARAALRERLKGSDLRRTYPGRKEIDA